VKDKHWYQHHLFQILLFLNIKIFTLLH